MNSAIELASVTKRFSRKIAVDSLDLVVPTGSIYGFIGPNGSGKTTTLRMILRIIQPDDGTVTVLGKTKGQTADDNLGYLPEERGMYKRMKVRDLLMYFARLKGNYDCRKSVDEWLERLEAQDWGKMRIDALSKGMAQKIQFISAVVASPKLVILDEPFSGLDPVNTEVLRDAVYQLRENGTTVIFSTHDMDVAQQMCDTIFMIFQGRKVLDGSLAEIQNNYMAKRARVTLSNAAEDFPRINGISEPTRIRDGEFEFDIDDLTQKQQVLQAICQQTSIDRFEIIKPSLHEIFVRIAKPSEESPDESNELAGVIKE